MPAWWIPIVTEAGLSALASWLFGGDETDYEAKLKAEMELERARNRLPDWAYERLKSELNRPAPGPHGGGGMDGGGMGMGAGMGGGGSKTGSFQRMSTLTRSPARKVGPTQRFDSMENVKNILSRR